jgi:hypothetical protein
MTAAWRARFPLGSRVTLDRAELAAAGDRTPAPFTGTVVGYCSAIPAVWVQLDGRARRQIFHVRYLQRGAAS